ncbi:hypothetical protein JOD52_001934 [Brachybacterium muris]|uniref:hypothetical protein n=1 Tax=Brachybacterium muris TaxID=219301 RepID=UPI00195651D1|nr:hypothetical protein [Brachybacterium muris]MBM7501094.1 hypothetical protein [Brachybacterium muris]MCT2296814.1 hypothetical protein [Brachybacterium muris]
MQMGLAAAVSSIDSRIASASHAVEYRHVDARKREQVCMRTNTWLGLIFLTQVDQKFQDRRIAKEQKARDEARDAMFAQAHAAAQQGQFAMWIQTPDGQRFERWSHHALEALRAIDDRQDAWELAWELDLQERREAARPQIVADAEASVPTVSAVAMRRARLQGFVAAIAAAFLGFIWLVLVMVAPTSPDGEVTVTPGSVVAMLLAGIVGLLAAWRLWVSFAGERRRGVVKAKIDQAIGAIGFPEGKSWHRRASEERLREVQARISGVVENASVKFPRNADLVQLAGTYDTRPAGPEDANAPATIQRLLEAFRYEDQRRVAELKRDNVA